MQAQPQALLLGDTLLGLEPAQPPDSPGPDAPIHLTGYTRTTLQTTQSGVIMDQSVKHQFFLNKQSGYIQSFAKQTFTEGFTTQQALA